MQALIRTCVDGRTKLLFLVALTAELVLMTILLANMRAEQAVRGGGGDIII